MGIYDRASTGISGVDRILDGLRLGDNVVWQVDSIQSYRRMVRPYVAAALASGRRVIHVRFGQVDPLAGSDLPVEVFDFDPGEGFERFATAVHRLISEAGRGVHYVFDSLTDLLDHWRSDLMVMNFFKVTCPFLYELDTVAYFAFLRGRHTFATIAGIRETTQLLLDVYGIDEHLYLHPLKVWERHSPTMYFPHQLVGQVAEPVTSSAASAALFASLSRTFEPVDAWRAMVDAGWEAASGTDDDREAARQQLLSALVGNQDGIRRLCDRWVRLEDLLAVAGREIGTGYIGGKSVGMLLARAILAADPQDRFAPRIEAHDSFYLGADLFYTYVVVNGWWKLWNRQKQNEHYFTAGEELAELMRHGRFPGPVRDQFMLMLEHFGQSPIIVRSSSLLEDGYGNAFAGKYESLFCANQAEPEVRYEQFAEAVRAVYASAMGPEALNYRLNRGLTSQDEQMAILVQRVSGDFHPHGYHPHAAGVANSQNLYLPDPDTDPDAGMLRLVFGMGTRAVDRTGRDVARIVTLGTRQRGLPPGERTQRYVDLISLEKNRLAAVPAADITHSDIGADWSLFASPDRETIDRLRESGRRITTTPLVLDFAGLLAGDFPDWMQAMLDRLEKAYAYPVDVEYTVNVDPEGHYRVNVVQCRPLQTRSPGVAVPIPAGLTEQAQLFRSGAFMGGNVRLALDHVLLVRPGPYLALSQTDRFTVARVVGAVNRVLKDTPFMIIGPVRWATAIPSLGVPAGYGELCNAAVLCETTYTAGDFRPELSWGSHFFQDLVESDTCFVALDESRPGVLFRPELVTERPNLLADLVPDWADWAHVVHVARFDDLVLWSDVVDQVAVCALAPA